MENLDINKIQPELIEKRIREAIGLSLESVKKMGEEISLSGKENPEALDAAFSIILHDPKKVAKWAIQLGCQDEIALELIKFIALADELQGNFYPARKLYEYVSDKEGQERMDKLLEEFYGVRPNDPTEKQSSLQEEEILADKKDQFLASMFSSSIKKLTEAAKILDGKTRNLSKEPK